MYPHIDDLPLIEEEGIALDIDETLSWTLGHWVREMQERFGNPEGLSVEELIAKYRYTQNVPYWKSPEVDAWVDEQLTNDDLQTRLPVIDGAIEGVARLVEIVPVNAYITIRPNSVDRGTKTWLDEKGFPEAHLISRPESIPFVHGHQWKARTLERLYPGVQGIVDDNAAVLHYLSSDYKGTIFLYDTEVAEPDPRVIACRDWDAVYRAVRRTF
jgi:5'(3')-deoxyribonucleotidase